MPGSRLERLLLAAAALVLAALVALIVPAWRHYRRDQQQTGHTVAAPARRVPHARELFSPPIAASTRRVSQPPGQLTIRAAGGDCWLELREPGSAGRVLYVGVLAQGRSLAFSGRRFWLRAGVVANLDLRYDGRRVQRLPTGTASVSLRDGRAVAG